ncbi:MAG TPA: c-type cytochrome [Kiritimatiellia bacterium]|nr:c-type cytochrome [Kiritimatiellia bacterium]HPS09230.1 c-type cytochrome [Kiritimatiellia bacterium]
MKGSIHRLCVSSLFLTVLLGAHPAEAEDRYLSPSSLAASKDGKALYVACDTAGCVLAFDTDSEKVTARYEVPNVSQLALAPDQSRLFATAGGFNGAVHEIDLKGGKIVRTLPAGHTPESPVLSADGKTLFYCNRFSRADQPDVHALDVASGKIKCSAKAIREPATMRLSKDGGTLWVVNYLPLMAANSKHVYASLCLYNSATLEKLATLDLPSGSFGVRDSAMSADGKYFFVSHSIGRFTVPTTHLDRGWINTSAVSVFDAVSRKYVNAVLLDDTVKGAANPWGLAVAGNDEWLCVNASGTHELIVVNLKEMMKRLGAAKAPQEVVNDLSFLYGAKTRVPLEGQGARSLAVVGNKVYSAMRFADSLNVVEMWDDGPGASVALPLGAAKAADLVRSGEAAFHDATCCYQQWLSCASCHPDTRSDGTNWDLLNDGIGNPKQSRSLLYSHRTSPVMITGVRASAEIAVTKGFSMIQFHELPEMRLDDVNAFVKSLQPVPSPYLKPDGTLTEAALRGKAVFEGKAACAKCHAAPYYGDKKKYAFGLGSDSERDREFATPILIEVWRTAPYMYDGRAVSIKDVITTDNTNNRHGNTKGLTPQEVEDLSEYVNSL